MSKSPVSNLLDRLAKSAPLYQHTLALGISVTLHAAILGTLVLWTPEIEPPILLQSAAQAYGVIDVSFEQGAIEQPRLTSAVPLQPEKELQNIPDSGSHSDSVPRSPLRVPESLIISTSSGTKAQAATKTRALTKQLLDAGTQNNPREYGPGDGHLGSEPSPLYAPKPPFPWEARRAHFEGRVLLDVLIANNGEVSAADVLQSSGRADCDHAALDTVLNRWRFKPALRQGIPVEWRQQVAIVYRLESK